MAKNDGGPAFPVKAVREGVTGECLVNFEGMTLRDWFAGMALQGIMSTPAKYGGNRPSYDAYQIADAMIAERDKA